jgi:hypothetical protein
MSAVAKMSTYEQFKKAEKNFRTVQCRYSSFGANDTEPDSIFQHFLYAWAEGKTYTIPHTGNEWELYANSMNCKKAAKALTEAVLAILDILTAADEEAQYAIRGWIRDNCWRYY